MEKQSTPEELSAIAEALNQDSLAEVEDLVRRGGDVSYIDAILEICQERSIDPEAVVGQIKQNKQFKQKLTAEAKKLRLLK